MGESAGWCQVLTGGVMVGLLIVLSFVLFVWVMVDQIKAYFARLFGSVINIGTALVNYFTAVINYLKSPLPRDNQTVTAATMEISTCMCQYIGITDSNTITELQDLLTSKLELYTNVSKDELIRVNGRITEVIANGKVNMHGSIHIALNTIDDFILANPLGTDGSLYRYIYNFMNALSGCTSK